MNILVTGATGFIGSHLCWALLQQGHEIFALSHSGKTERIAPLLSDKRLHLLSGDISSLPTMQEIMKAGKIDAVAHLAATPSHGSKEASQNLTDFESNTRGTLNVVHSCLLAQVPIVVYASAMGVYGTPKYLPVDEDHPKNPIEFISLSKLQGESYCEFYARNYGLHALVLRYAGVYGPGKVKGAVYNFTEMALRDQPLPVSSGGNQTRDLVYVGDVVSATVKALEAAGEVTFDVFNIGSGRETSVNELAAKVIRATGAHIDFRYAPASPEDRFVLDITKAQRVLNYQPRPLDDTLAEFALFLKSGIKSGV